MMTVNDKIAIPLAEFNFTFVRSSGPGGQNVNKLNTKVTLRWDVTHSASLPSGVRTRFCERYHRRVTKSGDFLISSQRFRDQGRNVADCLEKLKALLQDVATPPKKRRPTRRTRSSVEKRLRGKRKSSRTKQLRRKPSSED